MCGKGPKGIPDPVEHTYTIGPDRRGVRACARAVVLSHISVWSPRSAVPVVSPYARSLSALGYAPAASRSVMFSLMFGSADIDAPTPKLKPEGERPL